MHLLPFLLVAIVPGRADGLKNFWRITVGSTFPRAGALFGKLAKIIGINQDLLWDGLVQIARSGVIPPSELRFPSPNITVKERMICPDHMSPSCIDLRLRGNE